jgi:peroxiredoxin
MHTVDGGTVRAWDFKQKKSLVIAFLDSNCAPCEEFLVQLSQRASNFASHNAVVLVSLLDPPRLGVAESLPVNVIVGFDVSGRSARAFLGDDATSARSRTSRGIFVTDRYGELAAQWPTAGHDFPEVEAILTALRGIEIACEECFMPHWPVDL